MTRAEFEQYVNLQENKVADWADKEMGDKKLGSRLRKARTRKEMMILIGESISQSSDDEGQGQKGKLAVD